MVPQLVNFRLFLHGPRNEPPTSPIPELALTDASTAKRMAKSGKHKTHNAMVIVQGDGRMITCTHMPMVGFILDIIESI